MYMPQLVFFLIVFLVVFGLCLLVLLQWTKRPLVERLEQVGSGGDTLATTLPSNQPAPVWVQRVVELTGPLANLVLPAEGWENSHLRIRFMNAGYRSESALAAFFAFKVLLALALPALALFVYALGFAQPKPGVMLPLVMAAAFVGYFLPNGYLKWRTYVRQREIFETFPDALDLMTVCVEAGLGMDAALARVGQEMHFRSEILSEELHLVSLEMRAGGGRERALRNLALRTGVEDIDSLVAMLIQADRFGTSVADSLRVHADNLRTKRRFRAEELAAKLPVKILMPLLLCIFPALMLVLLGPSFISIYRTLFPIFSR